MARNETRRAAQDRRQRMDRAAQRMNCQSNAEYRGWQIKLGKFQEFLLQFEDTSHHGRERARQLRRGRTTKAHMNRTQKLRLRAERNLSWVASNGALRAE